jgi:serine/threonine protein kinase
MGCSQPKAVVPTESDRDNRDKEQSVQWKVLPSSEEAKKRFQQEGTLGKNSDPGHLELRTLLDDPTAQSVLFKRAKAVQAQDVFMCWIDINDFKLIPEKQIPYKRSKAWNIYHKYLKDGASQEVGGIEQAELAKYKADLEAMSEQKSQKSVAHPSDTTTTEVATTSPAVEESLGLPSDFYDRVQIMCFTTVYHNVFLPFKQTDEYVELSQSLQKRYNYVRLQDFEYFGKLGEGGFGFVVHCRKKSTQKHYAMKLQTKKGLIECFADDPWRADFEKQAFATCQHPFIVNLDYAFQTDSLAIMVLGLSTAGDLQKALNKSPDERLSEERVRFYVAEMVLALDYLHQMGLMYRDLKPNNVLLNEDGHIQLVDLGGVADENGQTLGKNEVQNGANPLLTQSFTRSTQYSLDTDGDEKEEETAAQGKRPKRKLSIMGTFGYMAPEMVIMLNQASYEKTGYTDAIDWWSLGVTMFKLLTGYRPFTDDNFNTFVEMATTMNALVREHCDIPEYAILFQEIPFPPIIQAEAKDLISKLLDVNPKTRLGYGPHGAKNIKAHPFFKSIDWHRLELKQIEPPFKPEHPRILDQLQPYPDFEKMMEEFGKREWLDDVPPKEAQKYFVNWNFTSPHTVRIESGLAHASEQYDRNPKLKSLMGENNVVPSKK